MEICELPLSTEDGPCKNVHTPAGYPSTADAQACCPESASEFRRARNPCPRHRHGQPSCPCSKPLFRPRHRATLPSAMLAEEIPDAENGYCSARHHAESVREPPPTTPPRFSPMCRHRHGRYILVLRTSSYATVQTRWTFILCPAQTFYVSVPSSQKDDVICLRRADYVYILPSINLMKKLYSYNNIIMIIHYYIISIIHHRIITCKKLNFIIIIILFLS